MNPIILTHCGKLGDFLYCLPIAEWFWRTHGRKVHWVLPRQFGPFNYLTELLLLQQHCYGVTLVDHKLQNLDAGGQPYRFNPADHGEFRKATLLSDLELGVDYFNLGFRSYPNCFISEFYCNEYPGQLDYVRDFELRLNCNGYYTAEILRSAETAMEKFAPQAEPLPTVMDLLQLARRVNRAKEFHTWYCGLAVLAWFAGACRTGQLHVYRMPGHANKELYFPGAHPHTQLITWHEVTL